MPEDSGLNAAGGEGRRVARNLASFGSFALSPLTMILLIRALGAGGYGRWWSSFVLLEAAGILGMLAQDLYVRREVSRLTRAGASVAEVVDVVGSSLAIVAVLGVGFAALQLALVPVLVSVQDDPELAPFLRLLAITPLFTNVGALLAAALQSRDVLASVAVLRGLALPILVLGVLFGSWQAGASTTFALALLLGASVVGLGATAVLYARHLPLGATLARAWRPRQVAPARRYGLGLLLPLALFTIGGKLDLYILGAYAPAAVVGLYGGCLQIASGLPNTRALFDPVIQTQVGGLFHADRAELAASLRRLTRLCLFALAPGFVLLIAIGEPVLGFMLGGDVAASAVPLVILSISQLVACLGVASWVVSMILPGRVLAAIAAVMLVVKAALLLALVPSLGLVGASIATAAGTVISMQGQALVGARHLGFRPYGPALVPPLVAVGAIAAGARLLLPLLSARAGTFAAVSATGAAGVVAVAIAIALLLDPSERTAVRRLLRRGER